MPLTKIPNWQAAGLKAAAREIGVDRDNRRLNGFLVAEEGPFRSEGRGEFDRPALREIVRLMRAEPKGLKSRFTNPTLSSDGLGSFLGRARNPRREKVTRETPGEPGKLREVEAVRADLYLSNTAFEGNPNGNLGDYLLDLATEDPDAMGASLVIQADEELRMDKKGRPLEDEDGHQLPPLWRPKALHAVDVVDTGDATRAFLSADLAGLPDGIVRQATAMLDQQFGDAPREVAEARVMAWLNRWLDLRYGPDTEGIAERNRLQIANLQRRNQNRCCLKPGDVDI